MSVAARLALLGIELPAVAAPVAAYVPALRWGDLVHTSGQLPFVGGVLVATGRVGAEVSVPQAADAARTATLNALAAVASVSGGLDAVARVVKVVVYVASTPDFHAQPAVANGASVLLGEIFGDRGAHVRSAIGVAALPLGSPVEVELTVALAWRGARLARRSPGAAVVPTGRQATGRGGAGGRRRAGGLPGPRAGSSRARRTRRGTC